MNHSDQTCCPGCPPCGADSKGSDDYSPGFMPVGIQTAPSVPPIGMEYPEGILPKTLVEGTKPKRPLTYLACPYSHPADHVMRLRYVRATEASAWLIRTMGWNIFSPITHSHPMASIGGLRGDWDFWKKIDTDYLEVSARLVVLELDGWRASTGVQAEIEIARKLGLEILYLRELNTPDGRIVFELAPCPTDPPGISNPVLNAAWEKALRNEQCPPQMECCGQDCCKQPGPTSKATTANPKDVVGATKVSLSKVPSVAIAHCAHAMMDGARKYDPYNWRAKAVQASIYVDAALRHIMDWFEGEEDAADSKVHHLGHAMACCAILLDCQATGNLIDDRPVTPKSAGIMSRTLDQLRKKLAEMPPVDRKKL